MLDRKLNKTFASLGKDREIEMLQADDSEFPQTKHYLANLIRDSLSRFELAPEQRK